MYSFTMSGFINNQIIKLWNKKKPIWRTFTFRFIMCETNGTKLFKLCRFVKDRS